MVVAGLIPAAGRGERLGGGIPKALRPLGGAPMLVWAVRALAAHADVSVVVVAAPPGEAAQVQAALAGIRGATVLVVGGGATRQESVRQALAALPPGVTHVLVHDAARPLVPKRVVADVVSALRSGATAVVPALPVADTVKRVNADTVVETLDRSALRAVQTPQGFRREVLEAAHAGAPGPATDDAGLVERLGTTVHVVTGADEAFKVTGRLDLLLAEMLVARAGASPTAQG